MSLTAGKNSEIIVMSRPYNNQYGGRNYEHYYSSIYGTLTNDIEILHTAGSLYQTRLDIEELI